MQIEFLEDKNRKDLELEDDADLPID